MFTGTCRHIWECPSCGHIYGGVAEGGIVKLCQWCPHRGVCDVSEQDDIPKSERLCLSVDCILAQVMQGMGHTKIGE